MCASAQVELQSTQEFVRDEAQPPMTNSQGTLQDSQAAIFEEVQQQREFDSFNSGRHPFDLFNPPVSCAGMRSAQWWACVLLVECANHSIFCAM